MPPIEDLRRRPLTYVLETAGRRRQIEIIEPVNWFEPMAGNMLEIAPHTTQPFRAVKVVEHLPRLGRIDVRFDPLTDDELDKFLARAGWKERR